MDKLLKALKEHLCVVSYKKIDTGNVRDMECTLDPKRIPNHFNVNQNAGSDHLLVWCTDRNDWRSFRVSTMVEWKIIE